MELCDAFDCLSTEVSARVSAGMIQSLSEKPASYPCVAIVCDGSRLEAHGGGSDFTGEHNFSLWVLCKFSGDYRESREEMYEMVQALIEIPRFYIDESVEYGEDVVHGTRCIIARIIGRIA